MAFATLDAPITPEHFEWYEPFPWLLEAEGLLGELERKIELAIECGEAAVMNAATAAIDLLDALDRDPDAEQDDWNERDEVAIANYLVDQTDNAAFKRPPILLRHKMVIEDQFDWWTLQEVLRRERSRRILESSKI